MEDEKSAARRVVLVLAEEQEAAARAQAPSAAHAHCHACACVPLAYATRTAHTPRTRPRRSRATASAPALHPHDAFSIPMHCTHTTHALLPLQALSPRAYDFEAGTQRLKPTRSTMAPTAQATPATPLPPRESGSEGSVLSSVGAIQRAIHHSALAIAHGDAAEPVSYGADLNLQREHHSPVTGLSIRTPRDLEQEAWR